jgi:hypothetical protein
MGGASAGAGPRPRASLLPGWVGPLTGEDAGWDAAATEEAGDDGAPDNAEPVGNGEPTARGVGSEGCGAQDRMRVGAGVGPPGAGLEMGAVLELRAEDTGSTGEKTGDAGATGEDAGVNGSRSRKRTLKRSAG